LKGKKRKIGNKNGDGADAADADGECSTVVTAAAAALVLAGAGATDADGECSRVVSVAAASVEFRIVGVESV
jgi:hypothetical protein